MQIKYSQIRSHVFIMIISILAGILLGGCLSSKKPAAKDTIHITIQYDGQQKEMTVLSGTTVNDALDYSGIQLDSLDETQPSGQTILLNDSHIDVIRVKESFEVEEIIIPFSRETVRNESLPEGQTLIIQPGSNGLQHITYRILSKDGFEDSKTIFKTDVITEARSEIIMVGVQAPFMAVPIEGVLAYLSSGNAWVMEGNTGNRQPVVTSSDLDGRVFTLSYDGKWLLFTRKIESDEGNINSLWIVDLTVEEPEPINLRVRNIIHHADWMPNFKRTISFSTVEPRATAPGWQANNDLLTLAFDEDGKVLQIKTLIETNAGGVYGWWGMDFTWSPDGKRLAYARPDSIGLVHTTSGEMEPLVQLIPLQTGSDWAWVPGIAWDFDHRTIFTVIHTAKSGLSSNEASPLFDLTAILPEEELVIPLVKQSGMFSYPALSQPDAENRVPIAYLQAIFPEQSETSRYRLMVMDRDGSNQKLIFPADGSPGMEPQNVLWSPATTNHSKYIALMYQNNLWLVDPDSGQSHQITGDRLINRIDWK